MRSLKNRLTKLERRQPTPLRGSFEEARRIFAEFDRMIDRMDPDDPRLPGLVPGWQLQMIRDTRGGRVGDPAEGVIPGV